MTNNVKMDLESILQTVFHRLALKQYKEGKETIGVTDLTTCLTKSYFIKKHGFPIDVELNLWALVGTAFHTTILPELAEITDGVVEPVKRFNYDNVTITAIPDLVTDNYVIELKTCNKIPDKPYPNHIEQTNAYMHIFDKYIGKIIYISRSQFRFKVYTILQDHELFNKTMQKAVILNNAIKRDKPPKPCLDEDQLKFYCKRCAFRYNCPYNPS